MGYRSDVVILVHGEASMVQTYRIMWIEQVRDMKSHDGRPLFDVSSDADVGQVTLYGADKGYAEWELRFEDVKWYDGYPYVDAYNKIWEECPDELSAEFLRLGEEDTDIQHELRGDEADPRLYVSRCIERY